MSTETTSIFDVNTIGNESGNPYTGTFKVRTLLSRRQVAQADEFRRTIIGASPDGVVNAVNEDAWVSGQLFVRVLESPEWFRTSAYGIDLPDTNITRIILDKALEAEKARKDALIKAGTLAEEKLKTKES